MEPRHDYLLGLIQIPSEPREFFGAWLFLMVLGSMTDYVVGFLFSSSMGQLVLIEKQRPEWQAGKCNGVGGKIEPGETDHDAMVREFREETGKEIATWTRFCTLNGDWGTLYCFYAVAEDYNKVETVTDEEILLWDVDFVMDNRRSEIIPNIRWLIQMAISMKWDKAFEFRVFELYYPFARGYDNDNATA